MKVIYFAGSIRGGRRDADIYKQLIVELNTYGKVLTEHVGSDKISIELSDRQIHDRDLEWLSDADILIAEVSTPSLGVGYEIGKAVTLDIPVVCLYKNTGETKLSAMISGSPAVRVFNYSDLDSAKDILREVFNDKS